MPTRATSILFIGPKNSGTTTLIEQLAHFSPQKKKHYNASIGIDCTHHFSAVDENDERPIQYQLIDTAGVEIESATLQLNVINALKPRAIVFVASAQHYDAQYKAIEKFIAHYQNHPFYQATDKLMVVTHADTLKQDLNMTEEPTELYVCDNFSEKSVKSIRDALDNLLREKIIADENSIIQLRTSQPIPGKARTQKALDFLSKIWQNLSKQQTRNHMPSTLSSKVVFIGGKNSGRGQLCRQLANFQLAPHEILDDAYENGIPTFKMPVTNEKTKETTNHTLWDIPYSADSNYLYLGLNGANSLIFCVNALALRKNYENTLIELNEYIQEIKEKTPKIYDATKKNIALINFFHLEKPVRDNLLERLEGFFADQEEEFDIYPIHLSDREYIGLIKKELNNEIRENMPKSTEPEPPTPSRHTLFMDRHRTTYDDTINAIGKQIKDTALEESASALITECNHLIEKGKRTHQDLNRLLKETLEIIEIHNTKEKTGLEEKLTNYKTNADLTRGAPSSLRLGVAMLAFATAVAAVAFGVALFLSPEPMTKPIAGASIIAGASALLSLGLFKVGLNDRKRKSLSKTMLDVANNATPHRPEK